MSYDKFVHFDNKKIDGCGKLAEVFHIFVFLMPNLEHIFDEFENADDIFEWIKCYVRV